MNNVLDLRSHFLSTYLNIRMGMALLSLAFPLVLWFGGERLGIPLLGSMSEYYHAERCCGGMRDVFVGLMIVIGAFLYLYKGYSTRENIGLNVAGIFAIGVALFPMQINCKPDCAYINPHGACAFGFFAGISYVLWFCAKDTLHHLPTEVLRIRFSRAYHILKWLLPLSVLLAYAITYWGRALSSYVFFVELLSVWTFSAFWIVKSMELKISSAEVKAVSGGA